MYPSDLKYTKDHEWVRIDGTMAESPASFGPTSGLAFPCGLHRARNADVYSMSSGMQGNAVASANSANSLIAYS